MNRLSVSGGDSGSSEKAYGTTDGEKQPRDGRKRRNLTTLLLILMLLTGVAILLYPSISNYWNSLHQSRAVMSYAESVTNMDREEYDKILQSARDYNRKISESGILWNMTEAEREEYESELNVDGSGVMGYIKIRKINVELPVYHGTDDAVLQTSIGHIEGSSLPVGGEGSHCILSGHRGLPSARLFTDLDKLEKGDTFTLTVLNETLTYEVDQILVVEPTDLGDLQIQDGSDLCTLVTCTPYGINTHRLLVRGHRIANENGDAMVTADAIQIRPVYIAPFAAALLAVLVAIQVLASVRAGQKKEK